MCCRQDLIVSLALAKMVRLHHITTHQKTKAKIKGSMDAAEGGSVINLLAKDDGKQVEKLTDEQIAGMLYFVFVTSTL